VALNNKYNNILTLVIFAIFSQVLYVDLGFALKLYMVVIFAVLLSNLTDFKLIFHKYDYVLLVFFLYYCITSLWSMDQISSLRYIAGILIILLTYFVLKYLLVKKQRYFDLNTIVFRSGSLFVYFSLAAYIYGFYIIGSFDALWEYNSTAVYGLYVDRNIPRLMGLANGPNFYGLYASFLFLYMLFKKGKDKYEVFLTGITFVTILLSFSRGTFLAIIIVLLFYSLRKIFLFLPTFRFRLIRIRSLLTVFLLVILLLYAYEEYEVFGDMVDKRLELGSGSGRLDIWGNAMHIFSDNPLFGIGVYSFQALNNLLFLDSHYAHNTYLEILVESGIIGIVIYLCFQLMVLYQINTLSNKNNEYILMISIYIVINIQILFLSSLIDAVLYLYLAFLGYYKNKEVYESSDSNFNSG
jgi:O-antigen ligase